MRRFIKVLLVLVLAEALLFAGLNQLYLRNNRNCGTMGPVKNDKATVLEVPEHISLCNLGSSHSYYALDYSQLPQDRVYFNFALPGQTLTYDKRILEAMGDRLEPGAVVLISISYFNFFGDSETEHTEFASKNQRYYSFLPGNYIKEYDLKTDLCVNWLPCLITETTDFLDVLIHPVVPENEWSWVCEQETAAENGVRRYESHLRMALDDQGNRVWNPEEIQGVYDLIQLARDLGATPVLFTTPYLQEYRDAVQANDPHFYDDFYSVMDQLQADTGVPYLNFQSDPRFQGRYELFRDVDHLNRKGADVFTEVLWEELHTQLSLN